MVMRLVLAPSSRSLRSHRRHRHFSFRSNRAVAAREEHYLYNFPRSKVQIKYLKERPRIEKPTANMITDNAKTMYNIPGKRKHTSSAYNEGKFGSFCPQASWIPASCPKKSLQPGRCAWIPQDHGGPLRRRVPRTVTTKQPKLRAQI